MGLFDFIKEAGKKLGIGDDEPPSADALKKELDSHKLGTENLKVDVSGDKAVIRGDIGNQEALEKAIVAIGNTIGVRQVQTDVKVAGASSSSAEPKFYTVKKGDTLWEIAKSVYGKGHGKDNKKIFEANKPMLKSADKIYPGQVLRIPQ